MAGKKGVFKKMLDFIGIVDDEPQQDYDYYDRESRSSQRPSTYVPSSQRGRAEQTRRRTIVPENNRYSQRESAMNDDYGVRRNSRVYEADPPRRTASASRRESASAARTTQRASQQMTTQVPDRNGSARTIMFSITNLDQCGDVVKTLIENNIVLLMLDKMDLKLAQRVVDTLSGAAFALEATVCKASDNTYLIAPPTVQVANTNKHDDR